MKRDHNSKRVTNTFNSRFDDPCKMKAAAQKLSHDIKLASWLGFHATNERGRLRAYQVKAAKISHALTRFDSFFRVLWIERYHHRLGMLVTIRLADKSLVRVPWQHLSHEAQSRFNLPSPYMKVVPSKTQTTLMPSDVIAQVERVSAQRVA